MERENPGQNELKEIEISVSEQIRRGVFSNHATIFHGPEEFMLDFVYFNRDGGTLNARVVLTPSHFKRLIQAMEQNLRKYEDKFGTIPLEILEREAHDPKR
jgi:hypothetical protein